MVDESQEVCSGFAAYVSSAVPVLYCQPPEDCQGDVGRSQDLVGATLTVQVLIPHPLSAIVRGSPHFAGRMGAFRQTLAGCMSLSTNILLLIPFTYYTSGINTNRSSLKNTIAPLEVSSKAH